MDVRCEKCQTEYELDESKLKPGGVTVKCTTCGHMFKVRRRRQTSVSSPAPAPSKPPTPGIAPQGVAEDDTLTWLVRLEDGEIKTCRELSTLHKWIVSGQVTRDCQISRTGKKWKPLGQIGELASFFLIADEAREARASSFGTQTREYPSQPPADVATSHPRTVPRRHTSSSAGAQIESPYAPAPSAKVDHVDTLRDASAPSAPPQHGAAMTPGAGFDGPFKRTLPFGSKVKDYPPVPDDDGPTYASPQQSAALAAAAERAEENMTEPSTSAPVFDEAATIDDPRYRAAATSQPPPTSQSEPAALRAPAASSPIYDGSGDDEPVYGGGQVESESSGTSGPTGGVAGGAPPGPKTGGWAAQGMPAAMSSGRSGPIGGSMKPAGQFTDVKFGGKLPERRGEFENGRFVPTGVEDDFDEPLVPPTSSAAKWIVLLSLILLIGAGGAVYWFLFHKQGEQAAVAALDAGAAVAGDAAVAVASGDAGAASVDTEAVLAKIGPAIAAMASEQLDELSEELAGADSGEPATELLIARARVQNARAEAALAQARLATDPARAKKLQRTSRDLAGQALGWADKAVESDRTSAWAQLAAADARRLAGERTRDVERQLRAAKKASGDELSAWEAELIEAALLVRDDRLREARRDYEKLMKRAPEGDVRAHLAAATVLLLDKKEDDALAAAQSALAIAADQAIAKAVVERIEAERAAAKAPDDGDEQTGGSDSGHDSGDRTGSSSSEESLDAALDRANRLAENGRCTQAMPLFRRVLDENPTSVAALTGLGYCHMDKKEFASAHSRFRAALGISPRYQPAMWGMAEAYQQQGLAKQAIERYRAFLDAHPDSPKAAAARRQIQTLGGSTDSGGTGGDTGDTEGSDTGGSGASQPDPPSEPDPVTTPDDDIEEPGE